jgi:hypothetical protein
MSLSVDQFLLRLVLMAAAIGAWYYTQRLIGKKASSPTSMHDYLHEVTAGANLHLNQHPAACNALLISSSLVIDGLGIYILLHSLLAESFAPFWGLLLLMGLRQISQFSVSLPLPKGMLWHDPGVPSLFVTYGVSNDLFFSGHTALAVYGACLLATQGTWFCVLGVLLALFEIIAVLVLRAHWSIDVLTGVLAALWAASLVL